MYWKALIVLAVAVAAPALAELEGIDANLVRPVPTSGERIVGGTVASRGQFPHQVGIFITRDDNSMVFCGGSILNAQTVITAAHCAVAGWHFEIRFGAQTIRQDNEVVRNSTRKWVHSRYQKDGALSNDIALLHFYRPVEFNDYIQPIRLPSAEQAKNSFWNANVVASGWGRNSDSSNSISTELRFVKSRVVSNLYCSFRYFFSGIRSTNICISGVWAKGTCNGDSGGPLVIYEADNKPTLIGITSFGISLGCEKTWPPAFTRVGSYLDWIEAGIKSFEIPN